MFFELKDGVTLDGVHPYVRLVVIPVVYGVTLTVADRKPIIAGARNDRLGDEDDPSTLHDNGLALDLRGNDLSEADRQSYADRLRVALWPLGVQVVGPYPLPNGHIHIELDPRALARAVAFGIILALAIVNMR